MNIKRNVVFSLEKKKKNDEKNLPIRMRIMYAGKRIDIFTGYRIDAEKWDKGLQRVKNGCTNKLKQSASDINSSLDKHSETIQTIFKEYEIKGIFPTLTQIKNTFTDRLNKKVRKYNSEKLINIFDDFIKESSIKNNWTLSTIKRLTTAKNHLNGFDKDLTFDDITLDILDRYVEHLYKKDLRNSSIDKLISHLKWFLRWSKEKGFTNNVVFENFKPKFKTVPKKVIFLSWDEINQLKEYQIAESKQYLERVRDVFLFLCYTGLRYSDVYNLKRGNIKDNHIEMTTIKTTDSLIIELNNYSREILEKYKDYHFKDNKALPVISTQRMNDYIKELAELAGINEPIRETYYKGNKRIEIENPKYSLLSTHAGRRTFICNSLAMGIPVHTIMKWTGHNDYKAMKPYVGVADKDRKEAMTNWDKKEVTNSDNLLDLLKQQPKENIISLFTKLLS